VRWLLAVLLGVWNRSISIQTHSPLALLVVHVFGPAPHSCASWRLSWHAVNALAQTRVWHPPTTSVCPGPCLAATDLGRDDATTDERARRHSPRPEAPVTARSSDSPLRARARGSRRQTDRAATPAAAAGAAGTPRDPVRRQNPKPGISRREWLSQPFANTCFRRHI
jgi:hypothetical protein